MTEAVVRSVGVRHRSVSWTVGAASIVAALWACGVGERSETFEFSNDRAVLSRPAERVAVSGLRFPPSNPARLKLQPVRVFPDLAVENLVMLTCAPDQSGRFFILERGG